MKLKLIIGFLLATLLVVFAIQNAEIVSVKFLIWHVDISRALLILISVGAGALAYSLLTFSIKSKDKYK